MESFIQSDSNKREDVGWEEFHILNKLEHLCGLPNFLRISSLARFPQNWLHFSLKILLTQRNAKLQQCMLTLYKSDYKIIYSVILNQLCTDCTFKRLFALAQFQNISIPPPWRESHTYLPTLPVFPGVSKFFMKSPGLPVGAPNLPGTTYRGSFTFLIH